MVRREQIAWVGRERCGYTGERAQGRVDVARFELLPVPRMHVGALCGGLDGEPAFGTDPPHVPRQPRP